MSRSLPLVQASILTPGLITLSKNGVDIQKYLNGVGLTPQVLAKKYAPLGKIHHFWNLFDEIEESEGIDNIGFLAGDSLNLHELWNIGVAITQTTTLYEALQVTSSLIPHIVQGISLNLSTEGEFTHIDYIRNHDGVCKTADQATIKYTLTLIESIKGSCYTPTAVHLQSDEPCCSLGNIEKYSPMFGEKNTRVTIPSLALAEQLEFNVTHPSFIVDAVELPKPGEVAQSLTAILTTLLHNGYLPSSIETAEIAQMSRTSLFRELKAENTSFIQIVERLRYQRAKQLLENPSYSIKEISNALGYANANNFSRSFKKLAGHSPTGFRLLQAS
ncbi:helix-turn-helix transcriptional regulator [Rubritalea sp.]|uniref:helix-turn-helix transcriptional regulator n=1 Tax=Rubritalea sp. TaxID=2109375 RepID=UPI003EF0D313